MTEDAAVFGAQQPDRRACQQLQHVQAEDDRGRHDLHGGSHWRRPQRLHQNIKGKGSVPADYDVPFAHTPAFVGSHITGYDNALKGILEHFWDGKAGTAPKLQRKANNWINFIGGFDGYTVGNIREIKRIFELMGIGYTILADNSDVFDTPPTASSACMMAARH